MVSIELIQTELGFASFIAARAGTGGANAHANPRRYSTTPLRCLATLADFHFCVRIENIPAITPTHD
jgi:hypothetical protein